MKTALTNRKLKVNIQSRRKQEIGFTCICVLPAFILFLIFVVYPVINMFYTAHFELITIWGDYNPLPRGFWQNYSDMFRLESWRRAFGNTVFFIFTATFFTIIISLFFASVLARGRTAYKAFWRIIFYIPNILSIVVIAAVWNAVYRHDGILHGVYKLFGAAYKTPILQEKKVLWALLLPMIWQAAGYYMVMYIAGMDSVPESLYEAANLDGASPVRQFFGITLPCIWETVRTTLVFFIGATINLSFLFVTSMIEPNDPTAQVLLTFMRREYANGNIGFAMANCAFIFGFAYSFSLIVRFLTRPDEDGMRAAKRCERKMRRLEKIRRNGV